MKKPLKECCNCPGKPPQPPSWVLCKDCLEGLDKQMHDVLDPGSETPKDNNV